MQQLPRLAVFMGGETLNQAENSRILLAFCTVLIVSWPPHLVSPGPEPCAGNLVSLWQVRRWDQRGQPLSPRVRACSGSMGATLNQLPMFPSAFFWIPTYASPAGSSTPAPAALASSGMHFYVAKTQFRVSMPETKSVASSDVRLD